MRFTKLSLFIAAAVGILTVAIPRAAHAVAAALVQVTNTASNPVIAQGIGNQAAQIVQIECAYLPDTQTYERCVLIPATGTFPSPANSCTVPDGQTLVVTSIDILSGSAVGSSSPCVSPTFAIVDTDLIVGNTIYGWAPLEILACAFWGRNGSLCVSIWDFVLIRNELSRCRTERQRPLRTSLGYARVSDSAVDTAAHSFNLILKPYASAWGSEPRSPEVGPSSDF